MIRVIVADDHTLFRQGLIKLLHSTGSVHVIGEAGNGSEALNLIIQTRPDIAILDISMPNPNGIEIARESYQRNLKTKIILLTMYKDLTILSQALSTHAAGYLLKDNTLEDLMYALKTVISGGKFISPSLAGSILKIQQSESKTLTQREQEVLKWIACGYSNKQIAAKLFISVKTVETHRTRIMQKLNLHHTADLVRYAIQSGLVGSYTLFG